MNSNKRLFTEQEVEELNAKWQTVVLRTVYTKDHIAAIMAAIDSTPAGAQSPKR
jgi:hypothetical protein